MTPTRELCQQVQGVSEQYLRECNLRSVAVYGGASKDRQLNELQKGIICTIYFKQFLTCGV